MKIALYIDRSKLNQHRYLESLAAGMRRHGDRATASDRWDTADVLVVWSENQDRPPWHEGPMLYLEAGLLTPEGGDYVKDRLRYISAGWEGVAGNAAPIPFEVDGLRWDALAADLEIELAAPREVSTESGSIVLCRQHPGDKAAAGADFERILAECNALADGTPYTVRDRMHPIIARRNGIRQPRLDTELEDAALCVTWNSTAACRAVVAGVPTVAMHNRSPAYEVAAHSLEEPWLECAELIGERERWAHRLAWQQWTQAELRDGTAWEFLKRCLADR